MKNTFLLLFLICATSTLVKAQGNQTDSTVSVRGRVTNTAGKPLAGALIVIANGPRGVFTDPNGYYLLTNVPPRATLAFSNVGYQLLLQPVPTEQSLLNQQVLNAVLELVREELSPMGATKNYKAVKINKNMPAVATLPESLTQMGTPIEAKAYFPTGIPGLMQYVAHHLHYPTQAKKAKVEGDVVVFFSISPAGKVDQVRVGKSLEPACDQEALRVVRQMPAWIPARQNGYPVASAYSLPIRFTIE